ncbi:MAG: DNA-directed RNA polymerase subunit beta', partial [Candidatus Parcubacteria bacterium]|nr:DNA-directed RNA polymerase subunit beta' [Candidatus Parcubacteria bacterium]
WRDDNWKFDSRDSMIDYAKEYKIPIGRTILVREGDKVEVGHQLCEGSIDLKKLFKFGDKAKTAIYIVKEIQRIYASQGVAIHDKHIETIVRQMFSRVRIKKQGDSRFSEGEIFESRSVIEENKKLKKSGKELAAFQEMILGISKVALTTDSFLSAASFEETSRILIKAAISGQEDILRGLKENVIIGKIIPVGSGYQKVQNEKLKVQNKEEESADGGREEEEI